MTGRARFNQPEMAPALLAPRQAPAAPLLMTVGVDPDASQTLHTLAIRRGFRLRACTSACAWRAAQGLAARGARPELLFLLDADAASGLERLRPLAQEVIVVVNAEQLRARCRELAAAEVTVLCRPLNGSFLDRMLCDAAAEFRRGRRYLAPANRGTPPLARFGSLHGSATVMRELFTRIGRMARSDGSVLIYGERGTGKARVARSLHDEGRHASGPFVVVDGRRLLEGAGCSDPREEFWPRTLQRARGGTLFINHLCAIAPQAQIPLLRALETATVTRAGAQRAGLQPLRLIAAVDREPLAAMDAGNLRRDVYERLAQFVLRLPPLRERRHDVVGLARLFLDELNQQYGTAKRLSPEAEQVMSSHAWPVNVRELRNVVEYAHGGRRDGACAHAGCSAEKCAHGVGPDVIGPGNLPLAVGGGDPFADGEAGQLRDVV